MISKGDLVKMRLSLGGDSQSGRVREVFILGRMVNYCDEEDSYIVEPRVISIHKDQVVEVDRLLEDFDFENASEELSKGEYESKRETPPDIADIRVSDSH
jgi:hypothetical protein